MAWSAFDDDVFFNVKVLRAGRDARDLWMASIVYCNHELTDGYVDRYALPLIAVMAGIPPDQATTCVEILLRERLYDPTGPDGAVGDGWWVHDYLDCQLTREEILERRAQGAQEKAAAEQAAKPTGKGHRRRPGSRSEAAKRGWDTRRARARALGERERRASVTDVTAAAPDLKRVAPGASQDALHDACKTDADAWHDASKTHSDALHDACETDADALHDACQADADAGKTDADADADALHDAAHPPQTPPRDTQSQSQTPSPTPSPEQQQPQPEPTLPPNAHRTTGGAPGRGRPEPERARGEPDLALAMQVATMAGVLPDNQAARAEAQRLWELCGCEPGFWEAAVRQCALHGARTLAYLDRVIGDNLAEGTWPGERGRPRQQARDPAGSAAFERAYRRVREAGIGTGSEADRRFAHSLWQECIGEDQEAFFDAAVEDCVRHGGRTLAYLEKVISDNVTAGTWPGWRGVPREGAAERWAAGEQMEVAG